MKTFHRISTLVVAAAALLSFGCEKQINYLKARNELNHGVKAFASANYSGAAERFEGALELDPSLIDARSYQAYAYMMQYIPGGESSENERMAQRAIKGFEDVLKEDETNQLAVSAMASLFFNMKDFKKAEQWHRRLIGLFEEKAKTSEDGKIDPLAADSFYTIGVIKWTQSYEPRLQLRADLSMKPEDPGPIKDAEKREELGVELLPVINDGMTALNRALDINPDYADAMAYLNLLNRERADFAESDEDYQQYLVMADDWVQKTLDTKKRLNDAATIDQFHSE